MMRYKLQILCKPKYTKQELDSFLGKEVQEICEGYVFNQRMYDYFSVEPESYTRIMEAKNMEDLQEKISKITNDSINNFQSPYVEEVVEISKANIDELVQLELDRLYGNLFRKHVISKKHFKKMDATKYNQLKDKHVKNKNGLYELLKRENLFLETELDLGRYKNRKREKAFDVISARDYFNNVEILMDEQEKYSCD